MVNSCGGAEQVLIKKELVLMPSESESDGQKEQHSLQRRLKEGRRGGEGEIGNKRKGEGGSSQKKSS